MQYITPHFWFDDKAQEAAEFYVSLFDDSKVTNTVRYGPAAAEASGQPEGSIMTVEFEIAGQSFMALNGGPIFQINPSISLTVHFDSREKLDSVWAKLSEGGKVLMELDKYDWSERYGWLQDRFGLSWQFMLASHEQKIVPSFLFVGDQFGKGKEAVEFYTSLFPEGKVLAMHHGEDGRVLHALFSLNGQEFILSEDDSDHKFSINEGVSFLVGCDSQEEMDRLSDALSTVSEAEQCGWVKDRFGVSWQIAPSALGEVMRSGDTERIERVLAVVMPMKRLDLAAIEAADRDD